MEIWNEVVLEFNEELDKLKNNLGEGMAVDYSHYRQIVGSIAGIQWARDNLTSIYKKRLQMEDDE